jgi:hypothetical protein
MQFQLHRRLPQDPDRGRSCRRSHSASRRRQAVHRRDHRSSQAWWLSDRPPLCRRPLPPRNPDPSLFWLSCAAAARPGPGTAVADPHVSNAPRRVFWYRADNRARACRKYPCRLLLAQSRPQYSCPRSHRRHMQARLPQRRHSNSRTASCTDHAPSHRALDSTGASRHKGSAERLASKQP